ncbi:MAG: VOC family protein [Acidobacteriota bacterium]
MIRSIKFVSVPVTDQDRALEFYTTKLGFRIVTDQPFDDRQRWIELAIPKAETRLVLFTQPGQQDRIGGQSPVTFLSDDVEATWRLFESRGVEFVQPAQKADWGSAAIFKDPDGNQFVIASK